MVGDFLPPFGIVLDDKASLPFFPIKPDPDVLF
jgi:hypothetical protein